MDERHRLRLLRLLETQRSLQEQLRKEETKIEELAQQEENQEHLRYLYQIWRNQKRDNEERMKRFNLLTIDLIKGSMEVSPQDGVGKLGGFNIEERAPAIIKENGTKSIPIDIERIIANLKRKQSLSTLKDKGEQRKAPREFSFRIPEVLDPIWSESEEQSEESGDLF